jgi:hypothetical protein
LLSATVVSAPSAARLADPATAGESPPCMRESIWNRMRLASPSSKVTA